MNDKPVLRELSVGELLDKAFRLYRMKFLPLLGITAAVLIPAMLLQILIAAIWKSEQAVNLFQSLYNFFFSPVILGALVIAVSHTYLSKPFTIKQAFSLGSQRYGSILGSNFLKGLAIGAPAALLVACSLSGLFLSIVGSVAYIAVAVYLGNRWSINAETIVLEDKGASDGLQRSWKLTEKHFWRVLGTSTAAGILVLLVTLIPSLSINYLQNWVSIPVTLTLILTSVSSQLLTALVTPFSTAVSVLIYYDMRIRVEAFDLEYAIEEPTTGA